MDRTIPPSTHQAERQVSEPHNPRGQYPPPSLTSQRGVAVLGAAAGLAAERGAGPAALRLADAAPRRAVQLVAPWVQEVETGVIDYFHRDT